MRSSIRAECGAAAVVGMSNTIHVSLEQSPWRCGVASVEMWSSQRGDVEQPTWRCGEASQQLVEGGGAKQRNRNTTLE